MKPKCKIRKDASREYQECHLSHGYRKSADGRMEPDEDVALNVQMIFQWASEGNTAAEITRKLYAMNIPTLGNIANLKARAITMFPEQTAFEYINGPAYFRRSKIYRYLCNWQEKGKRDWQPTCTQLKDESEWFKIPEPSSGYCKCGSI